jgi:glycyl-tRNA synthetase
MMDLLTVWVALLGDYLRADHLVDNVLKARLARGTRGLVKDSPKLNQAAIDEYNDILAQVTPVSSPPFPSLRRSC